LFLVDEEVCAAHGVRVRRLQHVLEDVFLPQLSRAVKKQLGRRSDVGIVQEDQREKSSSAAAAKDDEVVEDKGMNNSDQAPLLYLSCSLFRRARKRL